MLQVDSQNLLSAGVLQVVITRLVLTDLLQFDDSLHVCCNLLTSCDMPVKLTTCFCLCNQVKGFDMVASYIILTWIQSQSTAMIEEI